MMKKILTADGTETFLNEEYKEAYHSTKAGAYTESLYKFVLPCKIPQLAKKGRIKILDVGFGLGYNVAVAIKTALQENSSVDLEIFSIEKDISVFEKIKSLSFPENLKSIFDFLLSGKFQKYFLKNFTFDSYFIEKDNIKVKVLIGEGRQILKKLAQGNFKFDAVFYDAFSPKVNTEMWTLDIFKVVKNLMKDEAVLATYSASLAVRKGLLEAGFNIGLVEPVGRKSYSTVATVKGDIPPLTEKEKKRLETSPYAFPYRDENLSLPPEEIKKRWEKELKKRLSQT